MGGGITTCYQREAVGVEGPFNTIADSVFMPRFFFNPFTFGSNSDTESVNGGSRDPAALPGNHLLITWLKGNACLRPDVARSQYTNNICDTGIYRTTTMPATPSSLQKIVDDPNYHEFMAKVAEPYQFIYGIQQPQFADHQQKSPNNKCYLGSSSMDAEVDPKSAYSFNSSGKSSQDCAVQGCKARNVNLSEVKAIRFWEVLAHDASFIHASGENANTGQPNYLKAMTGNRLKLLGDAPLKPDGSFIAEIPCETPYVMAGVSQDGEVVLRDQVPQSLRTGEVRTCTGCHLHSGKVGRAFNQSTAGSELIKHFNNLGSTGISFIGSVGGYKELWKGSLQQQVTVDSSGVSTPTTEPQIYEYKKHIVPILNSSCVSCHSGSSTLDLRENNVAATFFAEIAPSHEQRIFLPTQLWNKITNQKPPLPGDWEIPRLSKYTHMGFAIESLFYWKTAGQRKDGRSDATITNDLDYGPVATPDPHANINQDHIRIIKNWIDSGSYLHQGNLPATYKPAN